MTTIEKLIFSIFEIFFMGVIGLCVVGALFSSGWFAAPIPLMAALLGLMLWDFWR